MSEQNIGQELKLTHIPAFDGLRGTVLTVLFVHLEMFCPVLSGHPLITLLMFKRTWYTLNIFFCLSGFLITWLLASEMKSTGTLNLMRFYKRRTIRLLPAYLTAIILAGLLASVSGFTPRQIFHDAAFFLTYTYNLFISSKGTNFAPALGLFLLPAWSLCVEEQFYFVWSVAFKWLKMKYALRAVVGTVAALMVYRCALLLEMRHAGHTLDEIFNRFYFGSDTRIHAILIGCAVALALQNRRYCDIARKYLKPKSLPLALPVGIAVIVFLTARRADASLSYQLFGSDVSFILLAAWIVCIMFQPESLVSRVLASRPFTLLGRISYGMYIFHFLVIRLVVNLLGIYAPPYTVSRNLAAWFMVVVITTLIATVHFYLIELPLQRRFKGEARIPTRPDTEQVPAPARRPQVANVSFRPYTEDAQ